MHIKRPLKILMADDDEDDKFMVRTVLDELGGLQSFHTVNDGEALLKYIRCQAPYADRKENPMPDIILLDLNMPRMDGWETLKELHNTKEFKRIPVIVFTTSQDREATAASYKGGASSVIVKPFALEDLRNCFETLIKYWGSVVELPEEGNPACGE